MMERLLLEGDWIYRFQVPEHLLKICLDEVKKVPEEIWNKNEHNKSTGSFPFEKSKRFKQVKKWVNQCAEEVRVDLRLSCERLEINSYWANKSSLQDSHHRHTHQNSWASSVLYVTESDSGTIFIRKHFWGTNNKLEALQLLKDERLEMSMRHGSVPGTMLIFPSQLEHFVTTHTLLKPRYTLAFNFFPAGLIGDDDAPLRLTDLRLSIHPPKLPPATCQTLPPE